MVVVLLLAIFVTLVVERHVVGVLVEVIVIAAVCQILTVPLTFYTSSMYEMGCNRP